MICVDCLAGHDAIIRQGFTPPKTPPREGTVTVKNEELGVEIEMCWVHAPMRQHPRAWLSRRERWLGR